MPRFADPTKTADFVLPDGCQCVGQPHEADWIRLRVEAGAADMLAIAEFDNPVGVIRQLATEWNLVGNDGKPAPLTPANIGQLFADFDGFRAWASTNIQASALPKDSGAKSSTGTSANGRPNRQIRRQRRSSK